MRASVTASLPLSISLTLDQVDATQLLRRGDRRRPIAVCHTAGNIRVEAIVIEVLPPTEQHERLVANAIARRERREEESDRTVAPDSPKLGEVSARQPNSG